MNILIIYSTNSGSTYSAIQQVADTLKVKQKVIIKEALDVIPEDLITSDAIILASPSWDYNDKEGQPHENIMTLIGMMQGKQIVKPFAILGLGDTSYTHFCGAVPVLENFVKSCGGTLLVDSLKVDQYYTNPDAQKHLLGWSHLLLQKLQNNSALYIRKFELFLNLKGRAAAAVVQPPPHLALGLRPRF